MFYYYCHSSRLENYFFTTVNIEQGYANVIFSLRVYYCGVLGSTLAARGRSINDSMHDSGTVAVNREIQYICTAS